MWPEDLERVRARVAGLDVDAELARAREQVVRWRDALPFSTFYDPVPLPMRPTASEQGRWAEPEDEERAPERVGFDAQGRPVIVVLDFASEFERSYEGWRWLDDGFEAFDARGPDELAFHRVADGRVVHRVGADEVALARYVEGRIVRVDRAWCSAGGGGGCDARTVQYAGDGSIAWVRRGRGGRDEPSPSLAALLDRAGTLVCDSLVWDARIDAPEPLPGDPMSLVPPLVDGLERAIVAEVAAAAAMEPFCVSVSYGGRERRVPRAWIAGERFRERRTRRGGDGAALLDDLGVGREAGDVVEVELIEHLGPEALRACRALSTATAPGAPRREWGPAGAALDAVGDALAERLLRRDWPREPFIALVELAHPYSGGDRRGLARARTALGARRLDAVLKALVADAGPQVRVPSSRAAAGERGELERRLAERGLAAHAHRLAHEVAAWGLRLEPGTSRSRLGPPGMVAPGEPWPTHAGRMLTLLAALDLSELPDHEASLPFPREGWLLFYADLELDEEPQGLVDDAGNEEGSAARVLYSDSDPVAADGPTLPRGRSVRAVPRLTLPDGFDSQQDVGLEVYDRDVYHDALPDQDGHWVGGLVTGAQGHGPEPGTTLLLHMHDDDGLGFDFLDAGTVQFRIPDPALEARDWSQVVALADSC